MEFAEPSPERRRASYADVYAKEFQILDEARARIADACSVDAEDWPEDFLRVTNAFESLLVRTVRLTRMGDRVQKQLVDTQKNLERTLAEVAALNDQLMAANKEKDEVIGIASHDLKNPLSGIQGIVGILREDFASMPPESIDEYLQCVEDASARMFRLINNLLDIHRIESGKLEAKRTLVDLGLLAKRAVDTFSHRAKQKGIGLELLSPLPKALVLACPECMTQILDNLVSNAVKYSFPDTRVEVGLELSDDASGWRVRVRDQGPGIPVAEQSRLFQKFSRLSTKPTGGESSTGLGLAIVRRLAEDNGATVWCESQEGKGATFFLSVPVPPQTDC